MRIKTAHQRRTRRAAPRRIVKLRKSQPVRRKPVQIRRIDLTAVAPDIRIPHIIRHYQNDIRPRPSRHPRQPPRTSPQHQHPQPHTATTQKTTTIKTIQIHLFLRIKTRPEEALTSSLLPAASTFDIHLFNIPQF
jgi:hypothetical protein